MWAIRPMRITRSRRRVRTASRGYIATVRVEASETSCISLPGNASVDPQPLPPDLVRCGRLGHFPLAYREELLYSKLGNR